NQSTNAKIFKKYRRLVQQMEANNSWKKVQYQKNLAVGTIPVNHNPKYLGINLDRNLNFKHHTELCLTFKKWSLSTERLINVYKVLIRSNMEYVPQLLLVNGKNIERLHGRVLDVQIFFYTTLVKLKLFMIAFTHLNSSKIKQ
ncbi:hypothetical protein BpHYR1_009025, partial [Brachionus plicatilis]